MDNLTIFRNELNIYRNTLVGFRNSAKDMELYYARVGYLIGLIEDDEWDYYYIIETPEGEIVHVTCCCKLDFYEKSLSFDEYNDLIDEYYDR